MILRVQTIAAAQFHQLYHGPAFSNSKRARGNLETWIRRSLALLPVILHGFLVGGFNPSEKY